MFENIAVGLLWIATTYLVANVILGVLDGFQAAHVELKRQVNKKLDEIIHRVKEEQVNDVIYWYDQDDGEFLAQGRSQQEIIDVIKERFPDHLFYLDSNKIISKPHWEPRSIQIADK